jgi:hypothetical protein
MSKRNPIINVCIGNGIHVYRWDTVHEYQETWRNEARWLHVLMSHKIPAVHFDGMSRWDVPHAGGPTYDQMWLVLAQQHMEDSLMRERGERAMLDHEGRP